MAKFVLTLDLDGTITADPSTWKSLCGALRKSGEWEVHVVTADKKGKPAKKDYEKREAQLKKLGFEAGSEYDDLMIVGPPIAENKRRYCKTVGSKLHFDNRSENIFAVYGAAPVALYANADASPDDKPDPGY